MTQIQINRVNYWQGQKVKIDIVDKDKGIAVFTFSPTKFIAKAYKILMVDADKAHLFNTVINYCKTDKIEEFDFDKIDFIKLEK